MTLLVFLNQKLSRRNERAFFFLLTKLENSGIIVSNEPISIPQQPRLPAGKPAVRRLPCLGRLGLPHARTRM